MKHASSVVLLALAPLAPFGSAVAHGQSAYEPVLLGVPAEGTAALPSAINEAGVCAGGFFNLASSYFDGVVWDTAGAPTALSAAFGLLEANAFRVEEDGTIVGSGTSDPLEVSHGVLIAADGTITTLPSLAGDAGVVGQAFDRNDQGVVVGRSALVPWPFWLAVANEAVVWESGTVTSLGTLGGFFSDARRVNEAKRIIGSSNTAESDFARGYVWDPGVGMREITPFEEGGTGQVADLNEQGWICGSASVGGLSRACVWPDPDQPPVLLPLLDGDFYSQANGIDESGTVVVGSGSTAGGTSRARLWVNGQGFDLHALIDGPFDPPLSSALDVNEAGRIVATAGLSSVLLSPLPLLTASTSSVSVAAGGSQALDVNGGSALAGKLHLVLGTTSGTQPGVPVGPLVVPLNPDAYTSLSLSAPGAPPLLGALGLLDAAGEADATFTLPPASPPVLVGLEVHHAFVALDPTTGALLGVSNAVALDLEP